MIAIYVRQSVKNEDSISIQTQIETCARKVNKKISECKVYSDEGYSGSNLNRPNFEQMMHDIRNGLIEVVVVYKLDRISRSLLDFFQTYEEFNMYNVAFVSCNEHFDTSNPMGKAMLSIIVVFAQLEKETIQLRIKDNYYSRGEKGFYLGGRPPFGYDKVKTEHQGRKTYKFEINDKQAQIVKEIFEKYANTDISSGKLEKWLNKQDIKTNMGNAWSSVQVGRLIRNPAYVRANADVYLYYKNKGATMNNDVGDYTGEFGCYLYATREGVKTMKFTDVSKSFVTLALHEGIVDADTWLRCQYKAEKNQVLKNSGKGTHSWLSGLLKCGYCEYAVTAVNGYKDILYINCGGRRRGICDGRKKVIQVKDIEGIVEIKLLEKLRTLKVRNGTENTKDERRIDELKSQVVSLQEQIDRLIASIKYMTGTSLEYINTEMQKLDKQKIAVQSEIDQLMREKASNHINITDLQKYYDNWDTYNLEDKKIVAKQLIDKVMVTDDEITVHFRG